ncbi:MAG: hypothetical protein ACYSUX_04740, partial [Planctomycetota bacterium]
MKSVELEKLIRVGTAAGDLGTPWFVLNSPELGKPFADFQESCKHTGVLDRKTKELLMTVLACVFR